MVRPSIARGLSVLALTLGGWQSAQAALDTGEPVPKFTAPAALGGKAFRYSLADALAKGPVVVYFFPAVDSADCSVEAHAFAEAIDHVQRMLAAVRALPKPAPR